MENKLSGSFIRHLIVDYLDNNYDEKEKQEILSHMEKYLLDLQTYGNRKGKA